ncbi:MAG: FAD-binding oxidoreductase [Myxococcales bacterium]|nr:FAD-binding oxidoreductase [Myxococcales bacterium]MDH5306560.1 FAD-binding oxidoreductase [Myxococcales bacterium]MDH5566793.1 FAD-binding oxidoreductase [Myxococcales bacterium]
MHPPLRALESAEPACFWLDRPERPEPLPSLEGDVDTDLAIVGGGFTGLWAAVQAKEAAPDRDVVLIEAEAVAEQASGRNGGFVDYSITHGLANGLHHFPDEIEVLEKLGVENYRQLLATLDRYGIAAEYEATGALDVATRPHELDHLREFHAIREVYHPGALWLDRDALRAEVDSPTYLGGFWRRENCGMLDPAKLAWGLRAAALSLGVRIHERTRMESLARLGAGMLLGCPRGRLRARQVVLATNAFRSPVRSMRQRVIPVWDYVLVTEPLSAAQRGAVGWRHRQAIDDSGARFHYYRLTPDDRILFGGYDAIYHFGSRLEREHQQRPESHALLARHFFETFPQLEGIRFTHRWGGPIATSTRFTVAVGSAYGRRVAWAVGYTGMGVGTSRFGARAALEQLAGEGDTVALRFVRRQPLAWPPEPLRWLGVQITQRALARVDETGRNGLWLRLLDKLGVGFDS